MNSEANLEGARRAFQDAIPARQDEFEDRVAEARSAKDHRSDAKQWYPNEVLRLARAEAKIRLDKAAALIKKALGSGGTSSDEGSIEAAFRFLFTQYQTMRNNPSRDLTDAIEAAVAAVAGHYPPDQSHDTRANTLVGKFFQTWSEAAKERLSELKYDLGSQTDTSPEDPKLKRIFLGYPFALPNIRTAVEKAALGLARVLTASDELRGLPLLHKIEEMMAEADLCLFDLTLHNPNVATELGIAQGKRYNYGVLYSVGGTPEPAPGTESSLFSDLVGWDTLRYKDHNDLERQLRGYLPKLLSKTIAPKVPAEAPLATQDRIPIAVSPRELLKLGENLTSLQARSIHENYIGEWIRGTVIVRNIDLIDTQVVVVAAVSESEGGLVSLAFSSSWRGRLSALSNGAQIDVLGQIQRVDLSVVYLKNCELLPRENL